MIDFSSFVAVIYSTSIFCGLEVHFEYWTKARTTTTSSEGKARYRAIDSEKRK